ncbi:MAG: hypothetical protein ABI664_16805 [bacterium]
MTILLITRVVLTLIGVAVWAYGRDDADTTIRYVGIAIIAVALLLRFAPKGWFDRTQP